MTVLKEPPDGDGGPGDCRKAFAKLILPRWRDAGSCELCAGMMGMRLHDELDRIRTGLRRSLDPEELRVLNEAIDRLRMLQVVEHALAVGDVLPDFALHDGEGRIVTSDELLARGPLALAFFRGPWCPYCSLTLAALEEARPAIERLGATLAAVAPMPAEELRRLAAERGLGFPLLSDPDAGYARVCGVEFEMSEGGVALYQRLAARFGLDIPRLDPGSVWKLPVPATYVAGHDGVIRYAFGDADWARRAEPADVVGAVERLSQAAETAGGAGRGRGFRAKSTNALTGGE